MEWLLTTGGATIAGSVVVVFNVWLSRLMSRREHKRTSDSIDALHGKLNGGLDDRINQVLDQRMRRL